MQKVNLLFLYLSFLLFTTCHSPIKKAVQFNLLPQPQQFSIKGVSNLKPADVQNYFQSSDNLGRLPVFRNFLKNIKPTNEQKQAQIICNIQADLESPSEGYILTIEKQQIQIKTKDEAGLMYAFMTLEQLMEDAREQQGNLPVCHIEDYPKLAYRAIHLDVKHHLEKTDYYYDLIDELAQFKINGIIVEIEDKLKYERQPLLGSADALNIDEWKKFSDYAKERHIEISPLIQGLGHASFILKHEAYQHLRDNPDSDWAFNPLLPETYEVQFDLYRDAMEATPYGRFLHVGGDEVHTSGGGSDQSPLELQMIWLNKVCQFAEEHGRIPIFWDDMPLKHAGVYYPMFNKGLTKEKVDSIWEKNGHKLSSMLDQFPKNCIYMRWNYSSPETIGNRKAMEWFSQNDLSVMGATAGQTRWVLMPQKESNMEAIRTFAEISINNKADGLLLTLWDDDSPHFELYKRGIWTFAEATWTGVNRSKEEFKKAYRHRVFANSLADNKYAFIDNLEPIAAFWKNAWLTGNHRNRLKSSDSPQAFLIDLPNLEERGAWSEKHKERLEKALELSLLSDSVAVKLNILKSKTKRNAYNLEVYEQVNQMAAFPIQTLLALQNFDQENEVEAQAKALDDIQHLLSSFKNLRATFEQVYSKTRILEKPENYILDQDHHVHLANQSRSFDWQFYADMLFLEKLEKWYMEIAQVKQG